MSETDAPTRSAKYVIPINAPASAVWRALTDPRELARWFPLTANVTPGVGGDFVLRWGDALAGDDWPIRTWEPERALGIGMPKPGGAPPPSHIATDFVIEDHGARTVLRVVASGFDADAKWDDFFHGIRRGWRAELCSMRHYLEHHRGENRTVAWARANFSCSFDEAWGRLFGPTGWTSSTALDRALEGERYTLANPNGGALSGEVRIAAAPGDFTGTIDELNNGLLRVMLEPGSQNEIGVWAHGYGIPPGRMNELQHDWQDHLTKLFTS